MITPKQAKKLYKHHLAIAKAHMYDEYLHFFARKIQRAIKREEDTIIVKRPISTNMQMNIYIDILNDYKEIGYNYTIEELPEQKWYKITITF